MEPQADVAIERIKELEAQLEDAYVKIDLLNEALDEREEQVRALKGQLILLRQDRRYVV